MSVKPDMNLPDGKTCSDCAHHPRCVALFGCPSTNTNCDWSPSRFVQAKPDYASLEAERDRLRQDRDTVAERHALLRSALERVVGASSREELEAMRLVLLGALAGGASESDVGPAGGCIDALLADLARAGQEGAGK